MYEGPEFRHFTSFVAVAEELNFGKAASRLHITQPALSSHIKKLEEILGAKVFRRVPAGAELTEAGRLFLPFARRVLHMGDHAVRAVKKSKADEILALRLGYSPFVNHRLIDEALNGYREIIPEGSVSSSSDCTDRLLRMIFDGRLDTAIVTLPIHVPGLFEETICADRLLICLRREDPLVQAGLIPKAAIAEQLRIMFNRECHPPLYDQLFQKFKKAGIELRPTETFSAPSEMQYLVRTRKCFGLVREGIPLEPELIALPMEGINIKIRTALVCLREQLLPVIPMLGYRLSKLCDDRLAMIEKKRPSGSISAELRDLKKTG